MPSFSSGPILNTGPNPSRVLVILISNDDPAITATVELEVFQVTFSTAGSPKTPVSHQLFTVPPQSVATRAVNITGLSAYETQVRVTGPNVVVNTFASDSAGNLNAARRVLQSEDTIIAAITPVS